MALDGGGEIDYHGDLWMVPWRKFGFDYCGVYVICPQAKWPIKIGISDNAAKRLTQLQTGHWSRLKVAAYWVCESAAKARQIESIAHSALEKKNKRLLGEWFDIRPDKAAELVEFEAEIAGIELMKRVPETAKFEPIKQHLDAFYDLRYRKVMQDKTV